MGGLRLVGMDECERSGESVKTKPGVQLFISSCT